MGNCNCPIGGNDVSQYPAVQECQSYHEKIIPDMYDLIQQHQNSLHIRCRRDNEQEAALLKNYLELYEVDTIEINKIIGNNLYCPLSDQTITEYFTLTKKQYKSPDDKKKEFIGKLKNLVTPYSSNILTFNFFEYWKNRTDKITEPLGLNLPNNSKISYEKTFTIDDCKSIDPHLDIYFGDLIRGAGIECKYAESYNRKYPIIGWKGFDDYLRNDLIWNGLDNLKRYADNLYKTKKQNKYFNIKQSICHILGLHNHFKDTNKYSFVYLYYASIFEKENDEYKNELEDFSNELYKDKINFSYKTYNELIDLIDPDDDDDKEYIKYNRERYMSINEYFNQCEKILYHWK
jgi:hypothetical protein